jgi:hypothetical protein
MRGAVGMKYFALALVIEFASAGGGGGGGGSSGKEDASASAHGDDDHSNHDHPSIFALGSYLNFFHATVCFSVLIVCTIVLEYTVHSAEHYISHKLPAHYLVIFNTVVKELMILGVISFSIFVGEQAFQLAAKSYYLALEFAHVTIFFAAIVFVVQATFLLFLMNGIVSKWDRLAARTIDSIIVEGNEAKGKSTMPSSARAGLCEAMEFHIMRHQFIKTHHLSSNFDFVMYLEKCLAIEITNTVDISIRSWSIVCASLWVNYALYEASRTGTDKVTVLCVIAKSFDNVLTSFCLNSSRTMKSSFRSLGVDGSCCALKYSCCPEGACHLDRVYRNIR